MRTSDVKSLKHLAVRYLFLAIKFNARRSKIMLDMRFSDLL